jgi:hypothetical protein
MNWYAELSDAERLVLFAQGAVVLLLVCNVTIGRFRAPRSLPPTIRDGVFGYDARYDAVGSVTRPFGRRLRAEGALRDQATVPRQFPEWLERLVRSWAAARSGDRDAAYEVGLIVGALADDRRRDWLLRAAKDGIECSCDMRLLLPDVGKDHQEFMSAPISAVKFLGKGNRIRRTWCFGILSPEGGPVRLRDGRFALAVCE